MRQPETDKWTDLRRRAEAVLAAEGGLGDDAAPDEVCKLLEELRTHQVELELQNEELREAHDALAEARDRYRDLYDFAPVGYLTVDGKGIIVEANLTLGDMLGVERGKLLGRPFSDAIVDKDQDTYHLHRRKLLETRERQTCELRLRRADGDTFWVHAECVSEETPDGEVRTRSALTDTTESKRDEARLQQYAQDLEQANAEVRDFAWAATHNLNGPAVNLHGFNLELRSEFAKLEAALRPREGELQPEVVKALDHEIPQAFQFIETAVRQMNRVLEALAQVSRAGQRLLDPEPVDVSSMVHGLVEAMAHEIGEREATVRVDDLPVVVADAWCLQQIFAVLIRNAVLYLDPARRGVVVVTGEAGERETVFHVRDNGRGIAENLHDRVFAPTMRAGATEDVPGDGVGLACARALIRRHHGRIWFESEEGVGSTFSLAIPHASGRDTPP